MIEDGINGIIKKVSDWFVGRTVNIPDCNKTLTIHVNEFIPSDTFLQFDGLYLHFYGKDINNNEEKIRLILFVDIDLFDAVGSTNSKFFRCSKRFVAFLGYRLFFELADLNEECLESI